MEKLRQFIVIDRCTEGQRRCHPEQPRFACRGGLRSRAPATGSRPRSRYQVESVLPSVQVFRTDESWPDLISADRYITCWYTDNSACSGLLQNRTVTLTAPARRSWYRGGHGVSDVGSPTVAFSGW